MAISELVAVDGVREGTGLRLSDPQFCYEAMVRAEAGRSDALVGPVVLIRCWSKINNKRGSRMHAPGIRF
jgi:hypothetical protein